jgi:hypothetical protein
MTIASRLYAAVAALALVFAGLAAVAPTPAQAQDRGGIAPVVIGFGLVATILVASLVLGGGGDEEGPQSP